MGKLIIVSNRLPVSVKKVGDTLEFYPSVGGLATGLSSYTRTGRSRWIGWPGIPSDELTEKDKKDITRELRKHHCYPVFLSKKDIDLFYNGYSNSVLWPLLHSLPIVRGNTAKNWQAYQHVNQLFAEATLDLSEPGSTIWVHDYQLMLMPALLRAKRPEDKIGFFLHIPFPTAKEFCELPQAAELVSGLLGADLVGVHTSQYTEHVLQTCRSLGISLAEDKQIALPNRVVRVTEFPIGIDYHKFNHATRQRSVQTEYRKLQWKYRGKKVIATVDRLDPTKGLVGRLEAYRELLAASPELHRKVVMVMLAVPTRTEITEYKNLKSQVETLVADINERFGTRRWQPVEYMYQTLPFEQLTALYERADVAFIAPIRDGMNLVAKEYLASKPKHDGVLVLSETAGAAEELKDAVLVDPGRPATLVSGLHHALHMSKRELQRRSRAMERHIEEFDIHRWADSFITNLQRPERVALRATKSLNTARTQEIVAAYHQAKRRLIFLDYDGVLAPFVKNPADAVPSKRVLALLAHLGSDPNNEIIIVSGRSKADIGGWFGELPLGLAAEHGALFRRKGGKNWHKTLQAGSDWKKQVQAMFEYYADATPGAHTEVKEWAIVWHYRGASPYYTQKHLVVLRRLLKPLLKQYGLVLKEGNKVLEVHPRDISKGRVAQEWLIHDHDFILCIGDDVTDEDMFATMPLQAYTVKVGTGTTRARLRLRGVESVLGLLSKL